MSRAPDGYLPPDRREANAGTPHAKLFYQQCVVCGRWNVWGDVCPHDREMAHTQHVPQETHSA